MADITIKKMWKELRISPKTSMPEEVMNVTYNIGTWGPFHTIIPAKEWSQDRLAREVRQWQKIFNDIYFNRGLIHK
jgi:hypothetical protein